MAAGGFAFTVLHELAEPSTQRNCVAAMVLPVAVGVVVLAVDALGKVPMTRPAPTTVREQALHLTQVATRCWGW
jgi:hypothetical protein